MIPQDLEGKNKDSQKKTTTNRFPKANIKASPLTKETE